MDRERKPPQKALLVTRSERIDQTENMPEGRAALTPNLDPDPDVLDTRPEPGRDRRWRVVSAGMIPLTRAAMRRANGGGVSLPCWRTGEARPAP